MYSFCEVVMFWFFYNYLLCDIFNQSPDVLKRQKREREKERIAFENTLFNAAFLSYKPMR